MERDQLRALMGQDHVHILGGTGSGKTSAAAAMLASLPAGATVILVDKQPPWTPPCRRCGREYATGSVALCATHTLCGECHEPDGLTPRGDR